MAYWASALSSEEQSPVHYQEAFPESPGTRTSVKNHLASHFSIEYCDKAVFQPHLDTSKGGHLDAVEDEAEYVLISSLLPPALPLAWAGLLLGSWGLIIAQPRVTHSLEARKISKQLIVTPCGSKQVTEYQVSSKKNNHCSSTPSERCYSPWDMKEVETSEGNQVRS